MPAGEFETGTGTGTIAVLQSDAFGLEFQPHTQPVEFASDTTRLFRRCSPEACCCDSSCR